MRITASKQETENSARSKDGDITVINPQCYIISVHVGLRVKLGEAATFRSFRHNPGFEPANRLVRLAIFEDSSFLLNLYVQRLGKQRSIDIRNSKTVQTVEEALSVFKKELPDIVITDLSLTPKGTEGFEINKRIRALAPNTIVVLTSSVYSPKESGISEKMRKEKFDAIFHKMDLEGLDRFIEDRVLERRSSFTGLLALPP